MDNVTINNNGSTQPLVRFSTLGTSNTFHFYRNNTYIAPDRTQTLLDTELAITGLGQSVFRFESTASPTMVD
jgi:hypothetical protein